MNQTESPRCPICLSFDTENLLDLNCAVFDGSELYRKIMINVCRNCGHAWNRLNALDLNGLHKYYNTEYARIQMAAAYKSMSRPGGKEQESSGRYQQLLDFLSRNMDVTFRVLDIGCGMGGFLDYLYFHGYQNLSGIDLTRKFVRHANEKGKYGVKVGAADCIPFPDTSFDILIADQVLEHMFTPRRFFQEAKRLLVHDGILYLGIPDASRYHDHCPFDFFWFLIRDHLQHFDIEHLGLLAAAEGFEMLESEGDDYLPLSPELSMPNIKVIFRRSDRKDLFKINDQCFELKKSLEAFVEDSQRRLKGKKDLIRNRLLLRIPSYVWGIGSEFLYLFENTDLKYCNINKYIDINLYKQGNVKVGGKSIYPPSILAQTDDDSEVMITAIAYKKAIRDSLRMMNYRGSVTEF